MYSHKYLKSLIFCEDSPLVQSIKELFFYDLMLLVDVSIKLEVVIILSRY